MLSSNKVQNGPSGTGKTQVRLENGESSSALQRADTKWSDAAPSGSRSICRKGEFQCVCAGWHQEEQLTRKTLHENSLFQGQLVNPGLFGKMAVKTMCEEGCCFKFYLVEYIKLVFFRC